jgi:tRNA modification GTPase
VDTIAAIATAPGLGGVGIIRLSGPEAIAIASAIVGRELPDRVVVHAIARDAAGARIDDVLAFSMRGPRSFTGEDVAEVHGHGGAVNLARLLRGALDRGARLATPGEFTRRAFDAGRIDLTRAEGLLAVIEAGSERGWRQAQAQLAGSLGHAIRALDERITAVLAEIEGGLDFPEDDLEVRGQVWVATELAATAATCDALAATYAAARVAREGLTVALVGAVNVGKSSLFNALIGRERALVDAAPGTTRDYVEAACEWNGYAITLIDTAGERDAADEVERRGIALGHSRAAAADVVVLISDSGAFASADPRALWVRSKADLGGEVPSRAIATSVTTGQGIEALRAAILERAGAAPDHAVGPGGALATSTDAADPAVGAALDASTDAVVTTERQRGLLAEAARRLAAASAALATSTPLEMLALDVRTARSAVVQVLGEEAGDAVVAEVFARFCIGK